MIFTMRYCHMRSVSCPRPLFCCLYLAATSVVLVAATMATMRLGVRPMTSFIVNASSSIAAPVTVFISQGSIVHFTGDVIVNAANTGGLGGGGVDGAVNRAGGASLEAARLALPIVSAPATRIPTGGAVLTIGGDLQAAWVVHAVGPDYFSFASPRDADALLASAYHNALKVAHTIDGSRDLVMAFSLLSAGVYRGRQTLDHVLRIGCEAVRSFLTSPPPQGSPRGSTVTEIHFVAFTTEEVETLSRVATQTFGSNVDEL